MAMEISMSVFNTKAKWPWKFPRQFLIQRQNSHGNFHVSFWCKGKIAMKISRSVLIQRQNGHGNFHVGFDTKAKWPWKFPTSFLAEVQSEHWNCIVIPLDETLNVQRQRHWKTNMNDERENFSTLVLTSSKTFSLFYNLPLSLHKKMMQRNIERTHR